MLNRADVTFLTVFLGAVVGVAVWFITGSWILTVALGLASAIAVGVYCYRLLK